MWALDLITVLVLISIPIAAALLIMAAVCAWRHRPWRRWLFLGFGLPSGLFLAGVVLSLALGVPAHRRGFDDMASWHMARRAGFDDADTWHRHQRAMTVLETIRRCRQAAETAAEQARREAEEAAAQAAKAAAEAACRADLDCWATRYEPDAAARCKPAIERLARYDFEWTDGWFTLTFSHVRWLDQKPGRVTFIGDQIKLQNGFGAWARYVYECDYDPEQDRVLDVRARQGRLPSS